MNTLNQLNTLTKIIDCLPTRILCCGIYLALFLMGCEPSSQQSTEDPSPSIFIPTETRDTASNQTEDEPDIFEGPVINSVIPTRGPTTGGITLRVIGEDFRSPMELKIGDSFCENLEVENSNRLNCQLPASADSGSVSVAASWVNEGDTSTLEDGFNYFTPMRVDSLTPEIGPANGGTVVTITGEGFTESTQVRFGGIPAINVNVDTPQSLTVIVPAGPSGLVDVTLFSENGDLTLNNAYRWQTPIGVTRIEPRWSTTDGDIEAQIYGFGLIDDSQIFIGGRAADIVENTESRRLSVRIPPNTDVGWASLTIENGNGAWNTANGILYISPEAGTFEVLDALPNTLPSETGGQFLIAGNGFDDSVAVYIDNEPLRCNVESPQLMECFTPSRTSGLYSIMVVKGDEEVSIPFTFNRRLEVYRLTPNRAAVSGGGLIKVEGRGFDENVTLLIDQQEVPIEYLESSEVLWFVAPPHLPGLTDLLIQQSDQLNSTIDQGSTYLPEALTYFDPISRFGGMWGEDISHSVNVTTLNIYDLSPVDGVTIAVRPFDDPLSTTPFEGTTNARGQVTISSRDLSTPLTLTASKADYEIHTIDRVSAENVTVVLFPFTPPEGDGGMSPGIEPVQINGTLEGLNDLPKPIEPGYILRAFIDTSHSGRFNRNFLPATSPTAILTEDGPFGLTSRPGQFALVLTVAYVSIEDFDRFLEGSLSYWLMRSRTKPVWLGFVQNLSLSPGATISDLIIRPSVPLNQEVAISLVNPSVSTQSDIEAELLSQWLSAEGDGEPPSGEFAPWAPTYTVQASLDLGPDGYWQIDPQNESESPRFTARFLPDFDALPSNIPLIWRARYEVLPNSPVSTAFAEQTNAVDQLNIGPFVSAPKLQNVERSAEVRIGDTLSWNYWPGLDRPLTEPPEFTSVRFIQSGLPVWSYTLPGGIRQITIPPLSIEEGSAGLLLGDFQIEIQTIKTRFGLNYQDYTLRDLRDLHSASVLRFPLTFTQ